MGQLKPGATYIYERDDQKIYAREFGSPHRILIGETMNRVYQERQDDYLWRQIRNEAEHNPALRDAMNRVLELYHLCHNRG